MTVGDRIMAENTSFRSAFKGFNREDVVGYIAGLMEKITAAEKDAAALQEQLAEKEAECAALKEERDGLQREKDELTDRCAALEREREEQAQHSEELDRKCREYDKASKDSEVKLGAAMLDAKRFSEMLVQEANDRAGAIYKDALDSVTASSEEAKSVEAQMKALSDLFEKSMGELRRNMRDLIGRMAAFSRSAEENSGKYVYRSEFSEGTDDE